MTAHYLALPAALALALAAGPGAAQDALDAPTQFVEVDGARLAYRTVGEGEPLILLHRFRAAMDDWDPALIDALAAGRQVIVFDSAGVGESGGAVPPTLAGAADVAAGFAGALGIAEADWLGWSMGGMTAQILAIEHPEVVRTITLAGTLPPGNPLTEASPPAWLEVATKPDYADEDVLHLFFTESEASRAAGLESLERMTRDEVAGSSVKTRPEVMGVQAEALFGFIENRDGYFERLGEIEAPAFVANGDWDLAAPAINSVVLAREIPDARLAIYPDAGHAFLFQDPERFADDVLRFLDE